MYSPKQANEQNFGEENKAKGVGHKEASAVSAKGGRQQREIVDEDDGEGSDGEGKDEEGVYEREGEGKGGYEKWEKKSLTCFFKSLLTSN